MYIGEHSYAERSEKKILNKKSKTEHIKIGTAYKVIKKKANELLDKESKSIKLRVSKQELKSVRKCFHRWAAQKGNYYQLRIPFKTWYIFEAIVSIVEEISGSHGVPEGLKPVVGQTYRMGFYHKQIECYEDNRNRIFMDTTDDYVSKCRNELHNDFVAETSPFHKVFGG